jgi:hypothetical protein
MSLRLDVDVDSSDYELTIINLQNGLPDFLPEIIAESAFILRDVMKEVVPVKTGKLKASIRADILPDSAEISTNSGYGKFVDQNTAPHEIHARGKEAGGANFLRFTIGGKTFFRRMVFHTGTKGQQFRRKTIKRSIPIIEEVMERKTRELLQ